MPKNLSANFIEIIKEYYKKYQRYQSLSEEEKEKKAIIWS